MALVNLRLAQFLLSNAFVQRPRLQGALSVLGSGAPSTLAF